MKKKKYFLDQSPSRLPRWVHVVRKTRAENSHAWATLTSLKNVHSLCSVVYTVVIMCDFGF
jgi:hypothetical protein